MLPFFLINDGIKIYSYPFIIGIAIGIFLVLADTNNSNAEQLKYFRQYLLGLVLSAWIGAKLLFLATTNNYLAQDLFLNQNFWLGGGFVFYGGMIFAVVFTIIFCRLSSQKLEKFRFLVPITMICHGLGRFGCFMAGCCYGSETSLWWGVHMHNASRHPVQLLESLALIIGGLFVFYRVKRFPATFYLFYYASVRFALEFLRGDEIRGLYGPFSTSQWISLLLLVFAILLCTQRKRI